MAVDYDARKVRDGEEDAADSLEELKAAATPVVDDVTGVDEANLNEDMELPGADLSGESLTVAVIPRQADEFVCTRCFLVVHASQRAAAGTDVCRDCD